MDEFDDITSDPSDAPGYTNEGFNQDDDDMDDLPSMDSEENGGSSKPPVPAKPKVNFAPGVGLIKATDNGTNYGSMSKQKSVEMNPAPVSTPKTIASKQTVQSPTRSLSFRELQNLTLHQCARSDDVSNAKTLINNKEGIVNSRDKDDLTPLHYAARHNRLNMLKLLIQHGADITAADKEGLSPLHYAARFKRDGNQSDVPIEPVIQEGLDELFQSSSSRKTIVIEHSESAISHLVNGGADINVQDLYGQTPLHYAAMMGNNAACRELLGFIDRLSVNFQAEDNQGLTPLHVAASHSHPGIVKMLIGRGASPMCKDKDQTTPFHVACTEGDADIAKMMLNGLSDAQNKMTMVRNKDASGNTCLSLAVKNGHYDVVKLCLKNGAEVSIYNDLRMYPLHWAAINGDVKIIQALIDHKAKIDVLNNENSTPLHKACRYNQVIAIRVLLENGADIECRDEEDYTPLLLASVYGHAATVDMLMTEGADITAVDNNEKTAIYLAAEENQLRCLEALLNNRQMRNLLNVGERYGNDPLHVASMKGYLRIVKCLIKHGADLEGKNVKVETPLHLAAKHGRTNIVKELVSQPKNTINAEDESLNTALHLAAFAGHAKVAEELIDARADVTSRNKRGWTPLDCASASGWTKTVRVLLDADSPIHTTDKVGMSPLHLAAKNGQADVVELLIQEWDADVEQKDSDGNNCLDLAIDNNNREAAIAVINSRLWQESLRNRTLCVMNSRPWQESLRNRREEKYDTPMRKLIRKMPDVAELVFDRCMEKNEESGETTYNYEFLDDDYSLHHWNEHEKFSVFDANGRLNESASPYTTDYGIFKENHPLMITVTAKRESLLTHPLVKALLRHKWRSFGRKFYYINFLIYALFLLFLTGYMVSTTPPYIINDDVDAITNYSSYCEKLAASGYDQPGFAEVGKYFTILLVVVNLLLEFFQLYQAKLSYLGWENLIEWVTYICSLLLVIDVEDCQSSTGYRFLWQWNAGTIAIFLAWINLLLFAQKFPRFGIYVVMFKDILKTFLSFFLVFFVFIIAFALAFFAMFQNQEIFETVWQSLIKTTVMMIGEFDFGSIFEAGQVASEFISYVIFCVFIVAMSIIIMNLMVGLAVDNIKEVQEQAELTRKAMQVELALDIERIVPGPIRRRFVLRKETISPSDDIVTRIGKTLGIESFASEPGNIQPAENAELTETQSLQQDIDKLKNTVNTNQTELRAKVTKLEGAMRGKMNNIEDMLKALMVAQEVQWQERDDADDAEADDIGDFGESSA